MQYSSDNFNSLTLDRDPFNYTLTEDMGTPVPFPLISVDASDLDQDTLNYTFVTSNVRILVNKQQNLILIFN